MLFKLFKMARLERRVLLLYVSIETVAMFCNFYFFSSMALAISIIAAFNNSVITFICALPVFRYSRFLKIGRFKNYALALFHLVGLVFFLSAYFGSKYLLIGMSSGFNSQVISFAFTQMNWQVWGMITVYILIVFMSYSIQYFEHFEKQKEVEKELRKQVQGAQLEALRYQLNPHFLFNSLNNINALIISDGSKAREMLVLLSDFLRQALQTEHETLIPISHELEQIERYLAIEKVRFGDRLTLDLQKNFSDEFYIPPLLLQPLIENVIKHGVSKQTNRCLIELNIQLKDERVDISVSNDLETLPKQLRFGTGLANVKKRLETNFNSEYTFEITTANSFSVHINIPCIQEAI